MKKVLVIGCGGSGKSTWARKLAAITHLPLFYLDLLWHKPDRTTVTREEFDASLAEILARPRWILDGNFQRTLAWRLAKCDTVFLFNIPLADCLDGVKNRIGKQRPEMPWIETEFDPDFRKWITNFKKDRLPEIERLLAQCDAKKIIFHSRKEADAYLEKLEARFPEDSPIWAHGLDN